MNDILILVIEDEEALRENILEIIAHYGFRTVSAASGEEGVKMALQSAPDIIVCDIMLPGIDGYDVYSQIKQSTRLITTAFIFLTAKSTRADTRAGMDMGADDYLTKPFTKEELINSIQARAEKLIQMRSRQTKQDALTEPGVEKIAQLTKAERKVLFNISEGFTTPQIAQKLFVSKKTIENHRVNISRKLDLSGPNSLINFALRLRVRHSSLLLQENLTADTLS
ncbi:MAG: response regulator transcription factor [Burkholderiales bacterium]|nr:response regulator transcription factor [Burkholderiales bacterium]